MRIGTYNTINQIYGSSNSKKTSKNNSTSYASFKDEVSFSSMGKDMQVAKNALADVPDVRESKINELKTRIDNGTYSVRGEDFAEKLMSAFAEKSVY